MTALVVSTASLSADELQIEHVHEGNRLTWTNDSDEGQFRVEWATDSAGPWASTWTNFTGILPSNGVVSVQLPSHFRVMLVSPISCDLAITPATVTLNSTLDKIGLRASGGTGNYKWSVLDVSKGNLNANSGYSVVYTRFNTGDNVVQVDSGSCVQFLVIGQP